MPRDTLLLCVCLLISWAGSAGGSSSDTSTPASLPSTDSEQVRFNTDFSTVPAEYYSILFTVLAAILGHWIRNYSASVERVKQAQISRLTEQIEVFYGPIYGCLQRTSAGFDSLVHSYAKLVGLTADATREDMIARFFDDLATIEKTPSLWTATSSESRQGHQQSTKESQLQHLLLLWCSFQQKLALPVNQTIVDILMQKAHLFDGPYPTCFRQVFAVVAERGIMIDAWSRGNYADLRGNTVFPHAIDTIVTSTLNSLAHKKAKLLCVSPTVDEDAVKMVRGKTRGSTCLARADLYSGTHTPDSRPLNDEESTSLQGNSMVFDASI